MTIWSPKGTTSKVPETPQTQVSFTNIWGCEIATKKQQPPRKTIQIPWLFRTKTPPGLRHLADASCVVVKWVEFSECLAAGLGNAYLALLLSCFSSISQHVIQQPGKMLKMKGRSTGWWRLKYFLNFHPETWGNGRIWRSYFSNGLKPPTSQRRIPDWFRTICKVC